MRAKRSLGQNFLRDSKVVDRIVEALSLNTTDTVVEIGPGDGALTQRLLERSPRVLAIEFDRDLIGLLNDRFAGSGNFSLIHGDALTVDFRDLVTDRPSASVKLVANLPYNISTPILQRLIEHRDVFSCIVLMFQREVVERITAPPGGKERGYLSVLIENAFTTEYLFDVPRDAFYPVPRVWSAVVRLTPKPSIIEEGQLFRELLSTSFAQKRKTILNNLKRSYDDAADRLAMAGIEGNRRAETLTLEEWRLLTGTIGRQ